MLSMKIKVFLFDDNAQRRDGVQMLIESTDDLEYVGDAINCVHALENIQETEPDVVLMDIDMPKMTGIEGVKLIRSKYPTLKILMQTVFEDDDKIFDSICAGADGYILKQANPLSLLNAIREVLEGGAPMTPVIARKVLQSFSSKNKPIINKSFDLSKRETEILRLLVKGYSYKMVADECCISYATVNTHITKIYQKLHVNSATGAVSLALREGLT